MERRAEALLAEITDETPAEEARRIEAEHAEVLRDLAAARREQRRDICARHGLDYRSYSRMSDDNFRTRALDELAGRDEANPTFPHVGTHAAPTADALDPVGEALYARLSHTPPSELARPLMHRRLVDLMRVHLAQAGVPIRGIDTDDAVIRVAMSTRGYGGMHTTSDFPTVLGDALGRRLGDLFRAAESGASALAAPGTVRDFRPITDAKLTSFPDLRRVNESGDITFGTLDESGERLAIATYARGITVSFQVLINDDLNAIDRSLRDVAFATAQLKARLIIAALGATLTDGQPLFHATHANLAGTGAAPDENTLSAGRVALARQTPPGSTEPLGLAPAILLVPSELQTAAEKLTAAVNPASSDDVSVFAGKLRVAVEPRLSTAAEWYLFADPAVYPVIRFLTLEGFEMPKLEAEDEFTRLGSSYRVHWHVGAGPVDHRGAWRNSGQ